ncbi:MAG: hypothetical protein AAB662_04445 [Patescibacteria group bacterium]
MKESRFRLTGKDKVRLSFMVATQAADAGTTIYDLHRYGPIDLNPIMEQAMRHGEDTGIILFKLSGILLLGGLYMLCKKYNKDFETEIIGAKNATIGLSLLTLAVAVNNLANVVRY